MGMETSEILFTRQRHDAKRAGLHYDIRLVHGDVAYSWATKKDIPKPGEAIILHQQPIHDTAYALSERVEIPEGQYGAGVTTLDFVRKAKLIHNKEKGYFTIHTKDGEEFLLKPVPSYGEKQWLFKNLGKKENKYLDKIKDLGLEKKAKELKEIKDAPAKQDLRPHTLRALKKLEKQKGLLVDHSMGSGKTLLYLKAIEAHQKANPKDHVLIMAPASLTTNVDKEIKKHGVKVDPERLETLSYEKATIDADRLKGKKFGFVVADEAHKLRNTGTKRHKELSEVIVKAQKRLLGTGTTAYNHPSDIAPLVNLAAGVRVLPEGRKAFEDRYIDKVIEHPPLLKRMMGHAPREVHKIRRSKELGKILRQHIDHYDLRDDPSAKDKFPEKIETLKEVEMAPEQMALYKYMEGKLPWHLRLKVRMNMPLDKRDTASLQAFSSGVRQVSNSMKSFMPHYAHTTPKITAAADSVEKGIKEDKNFKALIYSNFLGSGLADYSEELKKRGISHGVYYGGLSKTQKDKLLDDYNSGKMPILFISTSGAEGLNAKGTKKVQVLEPHFNASKIQQVVARGVRYESHAHLPKNERKVEVEHYLSVFPKQKFHIGPTAHSIDQYLHHNAKTKSEVGEQMKNLVKEAHFERVDHTYERAKYKETHDWENIENPVGSLKRDGAAFFMKIDDTGTPHFYSRRESVKGGFPDRTPSLPHLSSLKFPDYAGHVIHVELVHTGHTYHDMAEDSHPLTSGILNSKALTAIATQKVVGPIRAVMLDVLEPKLDTFGEKLELMRKMRASVGDPDVLHLPNTKIGKAEIQKLIEETKRRKLEGVVVTSLTAPEEKNIRIKVKHTDTYNLRVSRIIQEVDILGNPKQSMGALELVDASGRVVCNVGTGFTKALRKEIWENPDKWLGRLIQVKAMPSTAHKLRAPVYNGDADGSIDTV